MTSYEYNPSQQHDIPNIENSKGAKQHKIRLYLISLREQWYKVYIQLRGCITFDIYINYQILNYNLLQNRFAFLVLKKWYLLQTLNESKIIKCISETTHVNLCALVVLDAIMVWLFNIELCY